jgi:hypothetical protein
VLALSVVVAALRLPSLELPSDNDSGSFAYRARLIARGEPLYGTHHTAHQLRVCTRRMRWRQCCTTMGSRVV